ncbi:MAG: hypothetical protein ACE5EQ_11925 [Phycisphaerae bacterium]
MSKILPITFVLTILTCCSCPARPEAAPVPSMEESSTSPAPEARPVALVPKLAREELFRQGGCSNSIEPNPNPIPAYIQTRIDIARDYLKMEKLLPPEWELCAFEDPDDGWSVLCRPLEGYAFSRITVVLSDGKVKGYYYSDFSDYMDRWPRYQGDWDLPSRGTGPNLKKNSELMDRLLRDREGRFQFPGSTVPKPGEK